MLTFKKCKHGLFGELCIPILGFVPTPSCLSSAGLWFQTALGVSVVHKPSLWSTVLVSTAPARPAALCCSVHHLEHKNCTRKWHVSSLPDSQDSSPCPIPHLIEIIHSLMERKAEEEMKRKIMVHFSNILSCCTS